MLPSTSRMLTLPLSALALLLIVATIALAAAVGGHARPAAAEITCRLYSDGVVICSEEITVEGDAPETPKRLMPSTG